MKRNPLLDSIKGKIVDPTAVSIYEIMEDRHISRGAASEIRDLNLSTGSWEEVWKQGTNRIVRAYRLKKKSK